MYFATVCTMCPNHYVHRTVSMRSLKYQSTDRRDEIAWHERALAGIEVSGPMDMNYSKDIVIAIYRDGLALSPIVILYFMEQQVVMRRNATCACTSYRALIDSFFNIIIYARTIRIENFRET